MNWTFIVLETILCIIAFTSVILLPLKRNPAGWVHDYPKDIQDEYYRTHEVPICNDSAVMCLFQKALAVMSSLAFIICLIAVSGASSFISAFLVSYGIWLVVDWYDCFVMDWVIFANWKAIRLPGTRHMDEAYHQKKCHIYRSLWGMVIGLIPCSIGAAIYYWVF